MSFCRDSRSAATSPHRAEVGTEPDADGAAVPAEGLPAEAGAPGELPLEPQAAASSTRLDRRTFRPVRRLGVTLVILRQHDSGGPAPPHTRRVIPAVRQRRERA